MQTLGIRTLATRAAVAAFVVACLVAPQESAADASKFAKATADGKGYTIDYDAIAAAADLSTAQKFQVARSLRNGEGHVMAGPESIAGFSGKCKIDKILGIPDGGKCTLTASPTATVVLSKLGGFALTNAICLIVDIEDGELTEPFCDVLLEVIVSKTIEPVIEQCADKNKSTSITVGFKLVPPKIDGNAKCT